jgi:hypothetical protein
METVAPVRNISDPDVRAKLARLFKLRYSREALGTAWVAFFFTLYNVSVLGAIIPLAVVAAFASCCLHLLPRNLLFSGQQQESDSLSNLAAGFKHLVECSVPFAVVRLSTASYNCHRDFHRNYRHSATDRPRSLYLNNSCHYRVCDLRSKGSVANWSCSGWFKVNPCNGRSDTRWRRGSHFV